MDGLYQHIMCTNWCLYCCGGGSSFQLFNLARVLCSSKLGASVVSTLSKRIQKEIQFNNSGESHRQISMIYAHGNVYRNVFIKDELVCGCSRIII